MIYLATVSLHGPYKDFYSTGLASRLIPAQMLRNLVLFMLFFSTTSPPEVASSAYHFHVLLKAKITIPITVPCKLEEIYSFRELVATGISHSSARIWPQLVKGLANCQTSTRIPSFAKPLFSTGIFPVSQAELRKGTQNWSSDSSMS